MQCVKQRTITEHKDVVKQVCDLHKHRRSTFSHSSGMSHCMSRLTEQELSTACKR